MRTTRSVWLEVTENALYEGGRARDSNEVYFTLDRREAEFFGAEPVVIRTADGRYFSALASGHGGARERPGHAKNLRSQPATRFGEWLKGRLGVTEPGGRLQVTDLGDGSYWARYLPPEGPR